MIKYLKVYQSKVKPDRYWILRTILILTWELKNVIIYDNLYIGSWEFKYLIMIFGNSGADAAITAHNIFQVPSQSSGPNVTDGSATAQGGEGREAC